MQASSSKRNSKHNKVEEDLGNLENKSRIAAEAQRASHKRNFPLNFLPTKPFAWPKMPLENYISKLKNAWILHLLELRKKSQE